MPEPEFATKQDIRGLEERMDRMQDSLIEAMRDMQTEVVRAFRGCVAGTR